MFWGSYIARPNAGSCCGCPDIGTRKKEEGTCAFVEHLVTGSMENPDEIALRQKGYASGLGNALIDVSGFELESSGEFIGFVYGILSQDHDLEQMYLDSFLKLACLEGADIEETYKTLETISEKYHVKFVLSISMNAADLPECAKESVVVSL